MDIIQLYRDYGIPFKTEGHKHSREGWVNIACPFCTGNPGYHLGYNLQGDFYVCWRCGSHPVKSTISTLLNVSFRDAAQIVNNYGGPAEKIEKAKIITKPFKFPTNTSDVLADAHRNYLIGRNFDPDLIQSIYGIKSTGVFSTLDDVDYKWRIIIPIYWDGKIVTFTSRAINEKVKNRYMACPESREIVNIKKVLYGIPKDWTDLAICVEGPTDVWRMGTQSVATLGIKYKPAQIRLLTKYFKRVIVLYDDDPQAVEQANKLVSEIKFRGVDAFRYTISGDPGSLSDDDARHLVSTLKTYKIK